MLPFLGESLIVSSSAWSLFFGNWFGSTRTGTSGSGDSSSHLPTNASSATLWTTSAWPHLRFRKIWILQILPVYIYYLFSSNSAEFFFLDLCAPILSLSIFLQDFAASCGLLVAARCVHVFFWLILGRVFCCGWIATGCAKFRMDLEL